VIVALGVALQIAVAVTASPSPIAGRPFTVTVQMESPASMSQPLSMAPDFSPLRLVGSKESSFATKQKRSTRHEYLLLADRPGTYRVGPFEVRAGREVRRGAAVTVVVRAAPMLLMPPVVVNARPDTSVGVSVHAAATPARAYVGQQLTYQVAVFLDERLRSRLRRNPEFTPPEPTSMLAYDLPVRFGAPVEREVQGRRYQVHVFERAFFPLTVGTHLIPQAQLGYALPLSASYFSPVESHVARAETVRIVAVAPPAAGRPSGYTGAVGVLALAASVDSTLARVGDPLLLTVAVQGTANVKLLPRPAIDIPWASAVPGAERVAVDSTGMLVGGRKEFDWLLTPSVAGRQELPPVRYPYFNPYTERYEVALTEPSIVMVAAGSLLAAADTSSASRGDSALLTIRERFRPALPPPIHSRAWFWIIVGLAPVPAGAVAMTRWWKRPRRPPTPSRLLRRLASRRGGAVPSEIRRAYLAFLLERVSLDVSHQPRRDAVSRALRRAGVTADSARDAESLLFELESKAYQGSGDTPDRDLARRAVAATAAIDAEARLSSRGTRMLGAVIIAMLAGAAAVHAVDRPSADERAAASAFADGIRSYTARESSRARGQFARAAALAPRSPDAWANAGTAAWTARDTAGAAEGWQRALRLEPTADDVRSRLSLLPASHAAAGVWVPLASVDGLAAIAAACWLAAWLLAMYPHVRRGARWWAAALGGISLASAGATLALDDILAGERLAIASTQIQLRTIAALGADVSATAETGAVLLLGRQEGVWTQVTTTTGREGWAESQSLRPLARH